MVIGNADVLDDTLSFATYDMVLPGDDATIQALSFFLGDTRVSPSALPEYATT